MDTQSVTIHPKRARSPSASDSPSPSPLPALISTPAGLALLELQGSFNLPAPDHDEDGLPVTDPLQQPVRIGRIEFPDYDEACRANPKQNTAWMRRVQLYVGPHQRLTGEVKKLPRPFAVVRRRPAAADTHLEGGDTDLEVVEVIHYKLLFSNRPEPMTESGPV